MPGTDRDGKLTMADFMPCFDMFDVDQDSLITEAEFNGKVCASSFSSAGLDSNSNSNVDLWEETVAFDFLDIDKDGFISKAVCNRASGAPFRLA